MVGGETLKNKLPAGVEINGNKLRVYFRYNGEDYRESLGIEATPDNIDYAGNKIKLIKSEIATHRFNLATHFPQSKRLKENQLNKWLALYLAETAPRLSKASRRAYHGRVNNNIVPHLGNMALTDLTYDVLLKWQRDDLKHLAPKTRREIVANLHGALEIAVRSGLLLRNPCQYLKIERSDPPEPDPFKLSEIRQIIETPTDYPTGLNLARFMFYTGARVSEALAVAIEDIDFKNGVWHCQRATVEYQLKVTKTRRSNRRHELLPQALDAILDQLRYRQGTTPQTYDIVQRDNQTTRPQRLTMLFPNRAGKYWGKASDYLASWWIPHLDAVGVRYRGAGQCRHTYISQMLSIDMPLQWIIDQVGHVSEQMIRRHYGKWINNNDQVKQSDIAAARLKALQPPP